MALQLWGEFFDELQNVRGRSLNTVMAYRRDLELWDAYVAQKSATDIQGFYEFMKKQGLSHRSQARVISSLRTYYKFVESHGVEAPQLRELRPPKVKPSLPKPVYLEDFKKLFEACRVDNPHRTARNQITLLMLFGLGCRVSELTQLNVNDFHETEAFLRIVGKGGKERLVPLTHHLLLELKAYLHNARPHLLKKPNDSILINDRGQRPTRVDVWRWLQAWSVKAGFEETIHPHQFRHGCATALLEGGADLRTIQMLLGHSSLQTTQIYTSVGTHKLQETVDQHHPLSHLKDFDV